MNSERGRRVECELTTARKIYREAEQAAKLCDELVRSFPGEKEAARALLLARTSLALARRRYDQALYAFGEHVLRRRREIA